MEYTETVYKNIYNGELRRIVDDVFMACEEEVVEAYTTVGLDGVKIVFPVSYFDKNFKLYIPGERIASEEI